MILSNRQFLDSARLNRVLQDQVTRYQRQLPLRFLDRTAVVPAEDDEITASYTGRIVVADLIADDQAAVIHDAGKLEYLTYTIPNLKVGRKISQSMLKRLARMADGAVTRNDVNYAQNWQAALAADLRRGVEERMNALICAMWLDSVTYDRYGIKLTGTWGTPSAYKVTVSPLWTSPTTAKPVTDILTLKETAANDTGEQYDRLTLPLADFRLMTATTEFKDLIAGLVTAPLGSSTGAFNALDTRMQGFASQLLQVDIEFEDKTYAEQNADGSFTTTRVQPLGKVLLSTKADDKNGAAMDFGNASVVEAEVAAITGQGGGFTGGEDRGPLAYYTGPPDLNPPNVIGWGVARGFPRKHRTTATAVLTVR